MADTEGAGPALRSIPLDSVAISWHLEATYGVQVAPATIRSWGQRGLIGRRESHQPGRPGQPAQPRSAAAACSSSRHYRYDLAEVVRYLAERGLVAK